MDPMLTGLLTQQVKVYALTGTDGYGFQSYSATATMITCHIEGRQQIMADKLSETRVSSGRFFCDYLPWLNDTYRLEVPDASISSGWREVEIVAVTVRYNEAAADHNVVYFGERGNKGIRTNA